MRCSLRNAIISSKVSGSPGGQITKAQTRSTSTGSGIATQATLCTLGWVNRSSSISRALMLAPPRMIMSFLRPTTLT